MTGDPVESTEEPAQEREPPSEATLVPLFPIAAIGASAGGLAPITQLLRGLGASPGIAVVVIQHLDPTRDSSLVEILSKATAMPIDTASDGVLVVANHVYVIPPAADMFIARGALHLTPRKLTDGQHMPVDQFFRSLAEERAALAIGIILSGTGSDGSRGVQAIKAEEGITFAQDDTAEHSGMPRSAVATGSIDYVLPPDAIAAELARIGTNPPVGTGDASPADEGDLHRIILAMWQTSGIDFAQYKRTTLRRRIARRAFLHRLKSLHEYAEFIKENPSELGTLCEEALIYYTSFFRDPDVFDALKSEVFPKLLGNRRGDAPIRVWVPGCSSGEELYSIAICLLEFLGDTGASDVGIRMFGTDASARAIERARAGTYLENIAREVSPGRLSRFFVKTEAGYQIAKDLRDSCIFATQDLTRDPPLSRMDLISCRNLMIYLGPKLQQQRILPMFHYALSESGFLLLGISETVGAFAGFTALDRKNKIYARTSGATRPVFDFGDTRPWTSPLPHLRPVERSTGLDIRKEADRILLSEVVPAGVIVSSDLAIVEFRGKTGAYLEPLPGSATLDLLRMAREELRIDLRKTIDEARASGKRTRHDNVRLGSGEEEKRVEIDVIPFASSSAQFFLVLFKSEPAVTLAPVASPPGDKTQADAARDAAFEELKQELASTRHYLQSVIEQHEAANEELKAANEEIISSNEELQSNNEELQTAKEELQATNEELRTVNDEMRDRNADAARVNDDLTNVLTSVAIPIIFLGRNSRIRRFTPTAARVLNLVATDIGRSMSDIKLKIHAPELTAMIDDVLQHFGPVERTVQGDDGHWYQLAVRPYLTKDSRIDGAVITIFDIDVIKKGELLLAEARDYSQGIVETVHECLVVLDGDLRVQSANRAFYETFKLSPEAVERQRFCDIGITRDIGGGDGPTIAQRLEGLGEVGHFEDVRALHEIPGVGKRTLILSGRRIGRTPRILLTIDDITDRAGAEDALRRSEEGFRQMLTSAADPILMSDTAGRIVFANTMAHRAFGFGDGEMVGLCVDGLVPESLRAKHARYCEAYIAAPEARAIGRDRELFACRKDGTTYCVELVLSPMEAREGTIIVAFLTDVTERKLSERRIRDYQTKLQQMAFDAAVAEERERRRIAADLHDHIGQDLVLAKMNLTSIRDVTAGDVRLAIDKSSEILNKSIAGLRTLTFELSPPLLYDLGLRAALSWLTEEVQRRYGIHVDIVDKIADDGADGLLDQSTAALVFRAVRELLTNVFKHAQTPSAHVELRHKDDHFEIDVGDAGVGFDPEAMGREGAGGFGLFSVREQIQRLGGTLKIESAPRQGTRVTLTVPLTTGSEPPASGGGSEQERKGRAS